MPNCAEIITNKTSNASDRWNGHSPNREEKVQIGKGTPHNSTSDRPKIPPYFIVKEPRIEQPPQHYINEAE